MNKRCIREVRLLVAVVFPTKSFVKYVPHELDSSPAVYLGSKILKEVIVSGFVMSLGISWTHWPMGLLPDT